MAMRWRRLRQDLRVWLRRRGLALAGLGEAAWSRRWVKQSLVALALLLLLSTLHRAGQGLLEPLNRSLEDGITQPYDFRAAAERVQQSALWQSARVPQLVERLRQAIATPVLAPAGSGAPADAVVPALAPMGLGSTPNGGATGLETALLPPVPGTISRGFGHDPSGSQKNSLFQGLELETQPGTPVRAGTAGTVVAVAADTTYGQRVTIDHGDGLRTVYAFKGDIIVKPQQRVGSGGVLGLAGAPAGAAAARLYFEVQVDGRAVDPSPFLAEEGSGT
ncbi:MAG: murein hydrolase activator EnvC family protein [Symbiobacteriia bacterium]